MKDEALARILGRRLGEMGIGSESAEALLASMEVEIKVATEDYLEFLSGRLMNCDSRQRTDFQQRFDGLSSIKGQEYFAVMLRDRAGSVSHLAAVGRNGGRILYFIATN